MSLAPVLDSSGATAYVAHLPKPVRPGSAPERVPRDCVSGQRYEMGLAAMHAPWSWENKIHGTYCGC